MSGVMRTERSGLAAPAQPRPQVDDPEELANWRRWTQLRTPWPKNERALTRAEVKTVQTLLKTRGMEIGEIDGRAGPKLEQAVRAYQFEKGLTPDGYAGPALLTHLKAAS